MFRLVIHWLLSSIVLMIASRLVPGYLADGLESAVIAAVAIGFVNAMLSYLLNLISSLPAILIFGLFLLAVNTAMILLASQFLDGFYVYGWPPAAEGAAMVAALGLLLRFAMKEE